jgi:hypothetical protein
MIKFLIATTFLLSFQAFAYEDMTRHGYQSCIGCHYGPEGGGQLTDYGKIISATTSLVKGNGKKAWVNDKASWGGKLDHGLMLRMAHVRKENSDNRTFPMQGDYLSAFRMKKATVRATIARAPKSSTVSEQVEKPGALDDFYFRDLKLTYQMDRENYLSFGRSRQAQGLNIVDHTTYIKSLNRTNVTDLTTSLGWSRVNKLHQLDAFAFAPSFSETDSNKEYGAKGSFRYFGKKWTLGAHQLVGKTDSIKRSLTGLIGKVTFFKFLVMGELDYTRRWIRESDSTFDQLTSFVKGSYEFVKGVEVFVFHENAHRNKTFDLDVSRVGGGAFLRVTPRISWRTDYKITQLDAGDEKILLTQLFFNGW